MGKGLTICTQLKSIMMLFLIEPLQNKCLNIVVGHLTFCQERVRTFRIQQSFTGSRYPCPIAQEAWDPRTNPLLPGR